MPSERQFVEQYVLNAARGAGERQLNVRAAIKEAREAWKEMETLCPYPKEETKAP